MEAFNLSLFQTQQRLPQILTISLISLGSLWLDHFYSLSITLNNWFGKTNTICIYFHIDTKKYGPSMHFVVQSGIIDGQTGIIISKSRLIVDQTGLIGGQTWVRLTY